MKILWISHIIPYPPKTGVLQRSFNLLKQTSLFGDIYLIALHKKNVLPIKYNTDEVKTELKPFCKYVDIIELPVESKKFNFFKLLFNNLFSSTPLSIAYYQSVEMHKTITSLSAKHRFDFAYFDTVSLAPYLQNIGPTNRILNHHNIESNLLEKRSRIESNFIKRLYYHHEAKQLAAYQSRICQAFDLHFTVSELDKQLLNQAVPQLNTEVVPNGVDTDYFFVSQGSVRHHNLVIVSGMNWYPNRDAVEFMCRDIWPLLSKKFHNISLTVVGSHPPASLIGLSKKDHRIEVTGFVDDVRPFIAAAEVYLCPMRDGGGTRLKILDAMSMGKTIISTTKGCEGIDVTPGENVLIADTPAQFVKQISGVFDSPKMQMRIGESARAFVENKYSWRRIGSSLRTVYKSLG